MEDSEKLTALKKAYAETILNTAKEAAARIMVSERKALSSQQDLVMAKEEALRMLVRLKQMMDSKIGEAKMISLSQQKKIEELEAQLEEAEDIVRELREELREVQNALEKMTKKQLQPLDEKSFKGNAGTEVEAPQEYKLSASASLILPRTGSRPEPVTTSDLKNSTFNKRNEGNKCYGANDSYMENCFVANRDFASIVTRSKEPELYRNGCTQRIRAFESSLLEGKLSLSGQVDGAMNETTIGEEEEGGEGIYMTSIPKDDNVCRMERNPDEAEEIRQEDGNLYPVQAIKSFRRKRKRAVRYSNKAPSSTCLLDQVTETHQASDLSFSKTYHYAITNDLQSGETPSNGTVNESQKDPESPAALKLPSDATETSKQSECIEVAENDAEFVKACSARSTLNKNKVLIDDTVLSRQESGSLEISEAQNCTMDLETANVSVVNSDLKVSDKTDVVLSQPVLKYTFRRKRKKETLGHADGNISLEKNTLKRSTDETQNGPSEPQQASLIPESSRDSRQVAQVARQLISLSEKKWWQ